MLCKIRKNTLPIGFDWKVSAISYSKGCAPFTKCVEELRTFVLLFHTISQRFVNSERIFLYEPYTFCVYLIVLRLLAWLLTWGIVLTIWVLTAGHFCADSLGVFVLTVWALRLWSLPATWTCPKEEKSGMSFAKVDSPPSSWPVSCVGAAGSKLSLTLALFIPVICRCGLPFPCPQLVCKLVRDWPVLDQTPLKMTSAWSDASENDQRLTRCHWKWPVLDQMPLKMTPWSSLFLFFSIEKQEMVFEFGSFEVKIMAELHCTRV